MSRMLRSRGGASPRPCSLPPRSCSSMPDGSRSTRRLPAERYTLRQLLQHRAGVPDYGSLDAYHDAVARGRSPWPVGEAARTGIFARARVRARHELDVFECRLSVRPPIDRSMPTGKEIGEALSRLVLTPLGIAHAGFARTPDDLVGTAGATPGPIIPGWVYHGLMIGSPRRGGAVARPIAARRSAVPGLVARHAESFRLGAPIPAGRGRRRAMVSD